MKLTKKELFDISNTNDLPFEIKENRSSVKKNIFNLIKDTNLELSRSMIKAAYFRAYGDELDNSTLGRVIAHLCRDGDMIKVGRNKYKFSGE